MILSHPPPCGCMKPSIRFSVNFKPHLKQNPLQFVQKSPQCCIQQFDMDVRPGAKGTERPSVWDLQHINNSVPKQQADQLFLRCLLPSPASPSIWLYPKLVPCLFLPYFRRWKTMKGVTHGEVGSVCQTQERNTMERLLNTCSRLCNPDNPIYRLFANCIWASLNSAKCGFALCFIAGWEDLF